MANILSPKLFFLLFVLNSDYVCGQRTIERSSTKPTWITELPQGNNFKYHMAQASSTISLEDARKRAFGNVLGSIAAEQQVQVQVRSTSTTRQSNASNVYNIHGTFFEVIEIDTEKRTLKNLAFEEEYWQKQEMPNRNIHYECWILMRMPKTSSSNYRPMKYGFAPVWRSALVPGWGQLYKKQTIKGISLLAGTSLVVVGAIVADNQKISNYTKAINTRDISERRAFLTTSDNWENSRNVMIGVGAAAYLYNVIDAIASKGLKIYAFKSPKKAFEFQPYYAVDHSGINFTIHFN